MICRFRQPSFNSEVHDEEVILVLKTERNSEVNLTAYDLRLIFRGEWLNDKVILQVLIGACASIGNRQGSTTTFNIRRLYTHCMF